MKDFVAPYVSRRRFLAHVRAVRNIVLLYRVDFAGGRYEEGNYVVALDSFRAGAG